MTFYSSSRITCQISVSLENRLNHGNTTLPSDRDRHKQKLRYNVHIYKECNRIECARAFYHRISCATWCNNPLHVIYTHIWLLFLSFDFRFWYISFDSLDFHLDGVYYDNHDLISFANIFYYLCEMRIFTLRFKTNPTSISLTNY